MMMEGWMSGTDRLFSYQFGMTKIAQTPGMSVNLYGACKGSLEMQLLLKL
jgi:hypothetical protein